MGAPQTTDKYPIWLKQALVAMLDDPAHNLPKHLPFESGADRQQFQRLFYGYQKALAKEEELQEKMTGDSEFFHKELGQLMLRKVRKEETRQYPDAKEEYVIMLREDDPRTAGVQNLFSEMITEGATRALTTQDKQPQVEQPYEVGTAQSDIKSDSMADVLKDKGYF